MDPGCWKQTWLIQRNCRRRRLRKLPYGGQGYDCEGRKKYERCLKIRLKSPITRSCPRSLEKNRPTLGVAVRATS
jgi:hypothetical protein